jgi:serine/threonine-protein kinase
MALREKFGKLVLLEQTDSGPLGTEYRAARLGPSGFDRLVSVIRLSPAVSAHAQASKRLVEEARLAFNIHKPGLVRVLSVGHVGPTLYLSSELVEGRTLRAVLAGCRDQGFPFGADHALMIASRAAAGLGLLHGCKDESGRPRLHGLVSPRQLVVAFDGEVKVKGLGLWSALAGTELLAPEERAYLAPEQATARGDPRSDVYALGLVLLDALCPQAPEPGADPLARIAAAYIASPGGEAAPLPRPLSDLLRRALDADPAARFQSMGELRKAIDAQLFSGDFTPTTFDLAFFMHTLFREEVERDARAIEAARNADYREFMAEEAAKPPPPPAGRTASSDPRPPDTSDALAAVPPQALPPTQAEPRRPGDAAPQAPARPPALGPDSSQSRVPARARDTAAREAAARLSPGGAAPRAGVSRSLVLVLGLIVAVVAGGGAGWLYFLAQRRAAATARAPSPEQIAAEARVRELEARIAQLEREKAEAESQAADDARRALERQAARGGRAADPAAIERAQEEARRRARLEQEQRQQQELLRLAEEKRTEEQRLEAAAAAAAASPVATPAPVPTPAPTPPAPTPTPALAPAPPPPPLAEGSSEPEADAAASPGPSTEPAPSTPAPAALLPVAGPAPGAAPSPSPVGPSPADPSDPAVRPPGLVSEDPVPYPARAVPRRISTVVVVRALVDERGRVVEAAVLQPSGQPAEYGFDDAALKRVRSRRYRPARRNDVPVPIWVVVRVEFRPPPVR